MLTGLFFYVFQAEHDISLENESKEDPAEASPLSYKVNNKLEEVENDVQGDHVDATETADLEKDDDKASGAGTYTIDSDSNAAEVVQARKDIDAVFGVASAEDDLKNAATSFMTNSGDCFLTSGAEVDLLSVFFRQWR